MEDALDLLLSYDIRIINVYDLGLAPDGTAARRVEDRFRINLEDAARVLALGITFNAQTLFNILAVGRSTVLHELPVSFDLRNFNSHDKQPPWAEVVRVYELFRYQYRMGAPLATALLHLKRPKLVPVLLESSVSLYTSNAVVIGSEYEMGVPLYWEAVRQDLLLNTASLFTLRSFLSETHDARSAKLLALSDLRILCILAEQYAQVLRR